MQFRLMHPTMIGFPHSDLSVWGRLGLHPVGIARESEGRWYPVAIDDARKPHALVGDEPLPIVSDDFGPLFAEQFVDLCKDLWGHDWNSSVADIFGLNARTVQRDRISTNLLPPRIVLTVTYIAAQHERRDLADAVRLIARMARRLAPGDVRDVLEHATDIALERMDPTVDFRRG